MGRAVSWVPERDLSLSESLSSQPPSPGRPKLSMLNSLILPPRLATVVSRLPTRKIRSSDPSLPREETENVCQLPSHNKREWRPVSHFKCSTGSYSQPLLNTT